MKMKAYRHSATVAILIAVLFLPYWVYVPAICAAVVLLPFYWEAIIFGFLVDTLYGTRGFFPAALATALLVAMLIPLRERMRFTT